MTFSVGQKVVCVDASLPNNLWHCANPLFDRAIYSVRALAGPYCIDVDGSGRCWQNWRFRPLVEIKAETSFIEGAPKDSKRWDNRKRRRERV